MFKILLKKCCGLDVHKTWIYACIGITDAKGRTTYYEARFTAFTKGLQELSDWLQSYSCTLVCMESSGKFWIPVYNVLEKTCEITLSHPKYTKPLKGNKTDRKDARWICDLFMCGMIKPSFIPPKDIREMRDLVRYREKLTYMITGEKCRALNCLTVSNLKLDDVFTDVFGKSSSSIIGYMLDHPNVKFDVTPFVDKRCKAPLEEIQAAVDGAISKEQAVKLRNVMDHIRELEDHKTRIESEIMVLAEPYAKHLDLIRTAPGLGRDPMTAIRILSEIGADMNAFQTAKRLVSWAGCCPRNDKSSKTVKSTRISRAGNYLKPLLVQIAHALTRSKKCPEITERYRRIKARRGHKKAIIAICKMLLTAIWNILSKMEPYSADGYFKNQPERGCRVLTKAQAFALLEQRGFLIKDESSSASVTV